jgi:hypothetical protein
VGLEVKEEIVNAASGFAPKILFGTVTRQRALEEIASGNHDIIHIITHGREHVLQMSDGIIEEDMLEHAVCKANNARVLFINACRSAHTITAVYNRTNVAYAIGWTGNVSDQVAFTWARLFFEALRLMPDDITKATQTANEAVIKSYHMHADELPLVLNGRTRKVIEENERLRTELAQVQQQVEETTRLREETTRLTEELAWLRQDQARRDLVRLPLWLIIANVGLVVLLLFNLLILAATH